MYDVDKLGQELENIKEILYHSPKHAALIITAAYSIEDKKKLGGMYADVLGKCVGSYRPVGEELVASVQVVRLICREDPEAINACVKFRDEIIKESAIRDSILEKDIGCAIS